MQNIIDYIRQLRIDFVTYWNQDNPYTSKYERQIRFSKEQKLGKIALVAIQELIKIQHIKNGGSKHDPIMRMDGNADNYHELDSHIPIIDEFETDITRLLVKTAGKLLRYGS